MKAIDEMKLGNGWLDGEVIVPNEHGISDFQALQNAFDSSRTQSIIYYVFDIPFHDGYDQRSALHTLQPQESGGYPISDFPELHGSLTYGTIW